ncbi:MAG: PilZ domain-containing protein [Vicinamibacteria bacterium]
MSKYFPERVWPRLVPKGSVMVSVYGPTSEQAYGILSDVSEGGAQFVAGVLFETKSRVLLRIGFDPEEPFSTPAEIVWTRDESDQKHKANYAHGVRFRIEDPEQRERLRAILMNPDFTAPIVPGARREAPGLSDIVRDLSDELVELGDRIQNES